MNVTSLANKRKQKAMKEMVMLPVYDSILINDNGEWLVICLITKKYRNIP